MSGGADSGMILMMMMHDYGKYGYDAQIDSADMESGADSFTEPDMEEDSADISR